MNRQNYRILVWAFGSTAGLIWIVGLFSEYLEKLFGGFLVVAVVLAVVSGALAVNESRKERVQVREVTYPD